MALSTGAIVAIVISILVVSILVIVSLVVWSRHKSSTAYSTPGAFKEPSSPTPTSASSNTLLSDARQLRQKKQQQYVMSQSIPSTYSVRVA